MGNRPWPADSVDPTVRPSSTSAKAHGTLCGCRIQFLEAAPPGFAYEHISDVLNPAGGSIYFWLGIPETCHTETHAVRTVGYLVTLEAMQIQLQEPRRLAFWDGAEQ